MLTFQECTLLKLEKPFNLQQIRTHPVLQEWLLATADISAKEQRNWFFMILEKNVFCISQNYSATKEEIFDIFRILKTLKQKIIEMTE